MARGAVWMLLVAGCAASHTPALVVPVAREFVCPETLFGTRVVRAKQMVEEEPAEEGWEQLGEIDQTGDFPRAPVSTEAWRDLEGLDSDVTTALREQVIDTGLDARGLELREVEIIIDSLHEYLGKRRRAVGFVRRADLERPMVLVRDTWYTAAAIGLEVDLTSACRARLAEPPDQPRSGTSAHREGHYYPARPEGRTVDLEEQCPTMIAIPPLVASGELGLARQIATRFGADFVDVARSFRSALAAHQRGDDGRALQQAQAWADWFQPLQAEAALPPEIRFAGQLMTSLAHDQRRRRARGPRAPLPEIPSSGRLDVSLAPLLIDALEDLGGPEDTLPGGPADGYVVGRALLRIGPDVLPYLLNAIERDERLTRTVYDEHWGHSGVASVADVADTLLARLLPVEALGGTASSRQSLRARARHIRAQLPEFLAHFPPRAELERLQDTRLDPAAWYEAASRLARGGGDALCDAEPAVEVAILQRARDSLTRGDVRHAFELALIHAGSGGWRSAEARAAALALVEAWLDRPELRDHDFFAVARAVLGDDLIELAARRGCEWGGSHTEPESAAKRESGAPQF